MLADTIHAVSVYREGGISALDMYRVDIQCRHLVPTHSHIIIHSVTH